MKDQDGRVIEEDVATRMREAVLRSIQEQGFSVELVLYDTRKELVHTSLQRTLLGEEKEAYLGRLTFLDTLHRDEVTQRLVNSRDTWPTELTALSDLWDDIAWTYRQWRIVTYPSPSSGGWTIPARYRPVPRGTAQVPVRAGFVTRITTTTKVEVQSTPKVILFRSEYPFQLAFDFYEYASEVAPHHFSLYTRQQFGCRYTQGGVPNFKRPLHESLERHDPVPPHVREWIEGNLRQAFPEYRISIYWLNPDDKVPLSKVGDTDFQVSDDGIYEAPWGWRLRVERSFCREPGAHIECYDKNRKAHLSLSYYRDGGRPDAVIPDRWANGDLVTEEEYRHLEAFLDWTCSDARVVRWVDRERR